MGWRSLTRRLWRPLRSHSILPAVRAYDLWAPSYGTPPNAFQELEEAAILELLPELRNRMILDVGCGRGRFARLALDRGAACAIGLDASMAMLARSREPPFPDGSWAPVRASIEALPIARPIFDVICCGLVIGHVRDLALVLSGLAALLRTGGTLLISDFHPAATAKGLERTFTDPRSGRTFSIAQHLHPLEEYRECLQLAGVRLEELREHRWEGELVLFSLSARKETAQP